MTFDHQSVSKLIADATEEHLQKHLHRRTVKLLTLIKNGHLPKTSDDVLTMSSLTHREASLPDAKFDSLLWTVSGGRISSSISPTRFVKRANRKTV